MSRVDDPQILFITGNRLGDAVLTTGVLAHFIDRTPGARLTIACGALPAALFADFPGLQRVLPIVRHKDSRLRHWTQLWRSVSSQRWDDVIDVRSAFFAWTVRADHRWICRAEKRHEHRVEELARQLGLPQVPAPRLYVSAERAARIAASLSDRRPLLAVAPTANWGGKRWPAERFAELVQRLTAPGGAMAGARVAVFGAAHERADALPVLAATEDPLDLVGDNDLLDIFALLGHCRLFIGNDSGLMHLAATAGIPTLGLFGPSAEWRYRPWGPLGDFVRTPETLEELVSASDYDYRSHRSLMLGLCCDDVIAAAEALLEKAGRSKNPTAVV
jgi:ADP-heptose:LPS heptosyltransferase